MQCNTVYDLVHCVLSTQHVCIDTHTSHYILIQWAIHCAISISVGVLVFAIQQRRSNQTGGYCTLCTILCNKAMFFIKNIVLVVQLPRKHTMVNFGLWQFDKSLLFMRVDTDGWAKQNRTVRTFFSNVIAVLCSWLGGQDIEEVKSNHRAQCSHNRHTHELHHSD